MRLLKENTVLVSTPIVFRLKNPKSRKNPQWFIVKQLGNDNWMLPRTTGRRGESSVRAGIRMMAEQGGMQLKTLEEVGRSGGATKVNNKIVSQRHLYYLMIHDYGTEVLEFADFQWIPYSKAVKKIKDKKDLKMLSVANKMQKKIEIPELTALEDQVEINKKDIKKQ